MNYQLHHGDALQFMATLPDHSIDCCLTDLPYGTTQCHWDKIIPFEPMWAQLKRIVKPKGAIVLFGSQPFTSALIMSNPAMFKYEIIWEKSRPTQFLDARRKPLKAHENLCVFSDGAAAYNPQMAKGKANHVLTDRAATSTTNNLYGKYARIIEQKTEDKFPRSVVYFDSLNPCEAVHPTQKPVALLSYLIRTYTNEGETVLDFTMGSGSCGVAAIETGRKFIGCELDKTYFQIAADRIERAASKLNPDAPIKAKAPELTGLFAL